LGPAPRRMPRMTHEVLDQVVYRSTSLVNRIAARSRRT
jgi:hypothetical protein